MDNDEDRVLAIVMAQVEMDRPRRGQLLRRKPGRGPVLRRLLAVLAFTTVRLRRAYRFMAWHTWLRMKVKGGRRRWQELAGIGKPDNYVRYCRPQKIGYIVGRPRQ